MPGFWLWIQIGSRQHLPWHGSVAIRFAALGCKLSSGLAWDYVNCGLPQLPLCADFRSWETLHSRLIWSLGSSELLRAPLTTCLCFSPLLSASSVPALLLLMHVARMDRRGVGRGTIGPGFSSETPLGEPEHQSQFCAWSMGDGTPSFLFLVMLPVGVGGNQEIKEPGEQALRPKRKSFTCLASAPFTFSHDPAPPGSYDMEQSSHTQSPPVLERDFLTSYLPSGERRVSL